jgi:hypothetical protein
MSEIAQWVCIGVLLVCILFHNHPIYPRRPR